MENGKSNGMRELNFKEIEEVAGGGDFQRLIAFLFGRRSPSKPKPSTPPVDITPIPPVQITPPPPPPSITPFAIRTMTIGGRNS